MTPGSADRGQSYALVAEETSFEPGQPVGFRMQVVGPDGKAVTAYRALHERELHLIVVRRDLATFSHLHPVRDEEGTWETELTLPSPGPYRAFADVAPDGGPDLTLSIDLTASGDWIPEDLPPASETDRVGDYSVRAAGELISGAHSMIMFDVRRHDEPIELQPYLGALGHMVVLRAGDLAYLHVHPLADSSGNRIGFGVEVPAPGSYRLFLQFRHEDVVHTVAFTRQASERHDETAPPSSTHNDH